MSRITQKPSVGALSPWYAATYTVIALCLYREQRTCNHTSNYKTKSDGNIYCECGNRLNLTLDEFNDFMAGLTEAEED